MHSRRMSSAAAVSRPLGQLGPCDGHAERSRRELLEQRLDGLSRKSCILGTEPRQPPQQRVCRHEPVAVRGHDGQPSQRILDEVDRLFELRRRRRIVAHRRIRS